MYQILPTGRNWSGGFSYFSHVVIKRQARAQKKRLRMYMRMPVAIFMSEMCVLTKGNPAIKKILFSTAVLSEDLIVLCMEANYTSKNLQ